MSLKIINGANGSIEAFCSEFSAILTISNAKGKWTARMTRSGVQIFLVTGDSLLDAVINASKQCEEKMAKVGR